MSNENIVGKRLQLLRKIYFNQSQKEFAESLGITHQTISAYELGKAQPSLTVLIDISKKTNVSMDWLCGLDSNTAFKTVNPVKGLDPIKSFDTLGDVFAFFLSLFSVSEFSIKTKSDNKENDSDNSQNNWIELMLYHFENRYNPELIYSQHICEAVKQALVTADLKGNTRYPDDYFSKERAYWTEYYSKYPVMRN